LTISLKKEILLLTNLNKNKNIYTIGKYWNKKK